MLLANVAPTWFAGVFSSRASRVHEADRRRHARAVAASASLSSRGPPLADAGWPQCTILRFPRRTNSPSNRLANFRRSEWMDTRRAAGNRFWCVLLAWRKVVVNDCVVRPAGGAATFQNRKTRAARTLLQLERKMVCRVHEDNRRRHARGRGERLPIKSRPASRRCRLAAMHHIAFPATYQLAIKLFGHSSDEANGWTRAARSGIDFSAFCSHSERSW